MPLRSLQRVGAQSLEEMLTQSAKCREGSVHMGFGGRRLLGRGDTWAVHDEVEV